MPGLGPRHHRVLTRDNVFSGAENKKVQHKKQRFRARKEQESQNDPDFRFSCERARTAMMNNSVFDITSVANTTTVVYWIFMN